MGETAPHVRLPAEHIDGLFMPADARTVFSAPALFPTPRRHIHLRTDGSTHEAVMPLVALHPTKPADAHAYNLDVVRQLAII